MPFDPSTYLTSRGWQGKGTALDGPGGKGLKRPLTIPKKRDLHGLGKDRDRATQWWDCVFEAGAKALNISAGTSAASTPATSVPASPKLVPVLAPASQHKLSLASQAKREAARRILMSGFVRGEVLGEEDIVKPMHQRPSSDKDMDAVLPPTPAISTPLKRKPSEDEEGASAPSKSLEVASSKNKEERKRDKAAKAAAKAEKAAAKVAKAARRAEREAKKKAKEAKRSAKEAKKAAVAESSATTGELKKKRQRMDGDAGPPNSSNTPASERTAAIASYDATGSPVCKKTKKASKRGQP